MGKLNVIATKLYKLPLQAAISDSDLIVIPSNSTMSAYCYEIDYIYKLMNKKKLDKFCHNIYDNKRLKIGEIRVTPGFNIKQDIMFVRIPMNESDNSKEELLQIIKNMINIIEDNEYHEVFMLDLNLSIYGYDSERVQDEINELIRNNIQNMDIKISLVNSNISSTKN